MNDGEKPSRRSSGMYFLMVGNQVASEGEERSEATGGVGKKKARPLGELGRKKRDHWGSWEEKSEATGGKRCIENM